MFENMRADYYDSMLRAKKGYSRLLDPVCKQWELTRNELDVLLFLANNPDYDRASDIVNRRGIAKSHVSLSVGKLESKGLLVRRIDGADRRTVHLQLTEEAWKVADAGRAAQRSFFGLIYEGLTREELELWQGIVEKVSRNIEKLEEK